MSDSVTVRAAAGVSLLFDPGERPDEGTWREALAACQARAQIVRADAALGSAELVMDGLTFDVDGLAPAPAFTAPEALHHVGFDSGAALRGWEAVRLYPGHHLSGGLGMAPVVRAVTALAAEITVKLPTRAVYWHPSRTLIAPEAFAHATLAWLAGGEFPARVLTPLTLLADGSVVSGGLTHFIGQELALRPKPGESAERSLQLAERAIDHLVLHGPVSAITESVVAEETLCFEPSQRGNQLWVWRKDG